MTGSLKVKTSLSRDVTEFDVLKSLLTGPKGVSEIAKEFNVSGNPQDLKRLRTKVCRLLRKLMSKGLVVKDSDGRYRLADRCLAYIAFGPLFSIVELPDKDFHEIMQFYITNYVYIINYVQAIGQVENIDPLAKISIMKLSESGLLLIFMLYHIAMLYRISLDINAKQFSREESLMQYINSKLDKLWMKKLKPLYALLIMLMSKFGREEWKHIIAIISTLYYIFPILSSMFSYYEQWADSLLDKGSQSQDIGYGGSSGNNSLMNSGSHNIRRDVNW